MDCSDFGYLGNDDVGASTIHQRDWDPLEVFQPEVGSQWTSSETFVFGSESSSGPSATEFTFSYPRFETYEQAFSYPQNPSYGAAVELGLATPHRTPSPDFNLDTHIDPTLLHPVAYSSQPVALTYHSPAAEPFFATPPDAVAPVPSSSKLDDTWTQEHDYPSPPLTDEERGSPAVEGTPEPSNTNKKASVSSRRTYICPRGCGTTFTRKDSLKRHVEKGNSKKNCMPPMTEEMKAQKRPRLDSPSVSQSGEASSSSSSSSQDMPVVFSPHMSPPLTETSISRKRPRINSPTSAQSGEPSSSTSSSSQDMVSNPHMSAPLYHTFRVTFPPDYYSSGFEGFQCVWSLRTSESTFSRADDDLDDESDAESDADILET